MERKKEMLRNVGEREGQRSKEKRIIRARKRKIENLIILKR